MTGALGLLAHCGGGGNGDAPSDPPPSVLDAGADRSAPTAQAAPKPIPCDTSTPCAGGGAVACCNGFCANTSTDPSNCGQCGKSCSNGQFCDGTGCEDAVVANVCANPRGTVVLDAYDDDKMASLAMGAAMSAHCKPAPKIADLQQDAGGVVDPSTGRPITGVGNTFIVGGGAFGQSGISYIELTAPIAPVYLNTDGTTAQIKNRATGANVVDTMNATLTAHHDFFYVQLAVEPQSGTLSFSAEGIEGPGTQAAGYYVSAVIMPNLSTYSKTWYVFEWTDANSDSTADDGDTFTMVGSGP